LSIGFLAFLNS